MRVLLTGACGFVGHHFVEAFLKETDAHIIAIDKLTYAGSLKRLEEIGALHNRRVSLFTADFSGTMHHLTKEVGRVDYIIHMGGETHVDRSIEDARPFVMANVVGTMQMLKWARELKPRCFYYFSTDEVFGPAPQGYAFDEDDPHNPSNPYAASKSGGEMLVKSFRHTYKLPCVITRSMNIFGERQHPEKFIPLCVSKILSGQMITIHANQQKTKAGSRFYIHARNVASGYLHLMNNSLSGDYHITGELEVDNLHLAETISKILDKPLYYEMVDFHGSRPGHDLRYALAGEKMARAGWSPPKSFYESLEKTIRWTLDHPEWLVEFKSAA